MAEPAPHDPAGPTRAEALASRALALHAALRDRDRRLAALAALVEDLQRRERGLLASQGGVPAGTEIHPADPLAQAAATRAIRMESLARDLARQAVGPTPGVLSTGLRAVLGSSAALFDPVHYLLAHPEVAGSRLPPVVHYRRHGWRQARSPHPWFDTAWYRSQQGGGGEEREPVADYLERGSRLGLDPHPLFDTDWYRSAAGLGPDENPLLHWLSHGRAVGLSPHPLLDLDHYGSQASEVPVEERADHFVSQGWLNGWDPHPLFDVRYYLAATEGASGSGLNPLIHYLTVGWRAGARPHPRFDGSWYRRQHPDVAMAGVEPLTHYVLEGAARGWAPAPPPTEASRGS